MARDVRFIVVNTDEPFWVDLRDALLMHEGVKIVAEVEEPALIAQAVKQFPVDIVFVNLDPSPDAILPILGDLAAANHNFAIFASSKSTNGHLILKAMRLGITEFIPRPIDTNALGEAIQKIASHRVQNVSEGTLITVMGASGGVGATTVATNVAVELAQLVTKDVTVVDLDYRYGQVATLLDVEPTHTLADLTGSPEQLEPQVMERALSRHDTGVRVLSRPNHFAEADTLTAATCMGVFSTLMQMNEYVIADGPTRFDMGAKSLLALSDINLLVVQLAVPCIRNAQRILQNMRENGYNTERTRLICNRVGRDSGQMTVRNVSETLGLDVFATIPDDWEAVSGAINLGEPLRVHGPKTKVRAVIEEIAVRLHSPTGDGENREERKKGLLGRIFAGA